MKNELNPAVVIGVIAAVIVIVVIVGMKIIGPSRSQQAIVAPQPGGSPSHGNLSVSDAQRYQERMQQVMQQRAAEQHPQGR